jgi:hypothetical protein
MIAAQERPRHGDHDEASMIGQWYFMVNKVFTMRYMLPARGALRCTAWLGGYCVSAGLCYSQRSRSACSANGEPASRCTA